MDRSQDSSFRLPVTAAGGVGPPEPGDRLAGRPDPCLEQRLHAQSHEVGPVSAGRECPGKIVFSPVFSVFYNLSLANIGLLLVKNAFTNYSEGSYI